MSKLLLVDGNAILHRAYHALPSLTSHDGTPVNAVYGFFSMLLRVVDNLKPSHIIVAWDTAKPTFRHTQYTAYQAQRPRADSELGPQFKLAQDILTAMHIPVLFCEGFEADDVIGTVASQSVNSGEVDEVNIVTGDRDILQLVDDDNRVFVFMPIKGLSEGKLYHEVDVQERLGVKPSQIIDYKALVGDPSDNYPGVAGIGQKTAIELLGKFGTLESIYENLHLVPDKYAKKLAAGAEPAGISKHLATIVKDVPIGISWDEARKWKISSKEAIEMMTNIGFKSLTSRIANFTQNKQ